MAEQNLLTQGIGAYKAGNLEQAKVFFAQAIQQDPMNAKAWLWMSGVVEEDQRKSCLQRVLALEPGNQAARHGLALLSVRSEEPTAPPAPEPPSEPVEEAAQEPAEEWADDSFETSDEVGEDTLDNGDFDGLNEDFLDDLFDEEELSALTSEPASAADGEDAFNFDNFADDPFEAELDAEALVEDEEADVMTTMIVDDPSPVGKKPELTIFDLYEESEEAETGESASSESEQEGDALYEEEEIDDAPFEDLWAQLEALDEEDDPPKQVATESSEPIWLEPEDTSPEPWELEEPLELMKIDESEEEWEPESNDFALFGGQAGAADSPPMATDFSTDFTMPNARVYAETKRLQTQKPNEPMFTKNQLILLAVLTLLVIILGLVIAFKILLPWLQTMIGTGVDPLLLFHTMV